MFKITSNSRKIDKDLYNNSAENFIPIACHYNENTLLTKNGELLQTIQINGINAENISDKLFNLREVVRNAIKKNVHNKSFAFWIHTVRRKTNLDDTTPYNKLLPANIHNLWQQKNYWDDKFVNTLYISIIYDSDNIKVKDLNSLITSLSFDKLINYQNNYLDSVFKILNSTVDTILWDLQGFGAVKLGIRFEREESYSDLMFLYRRIVHLNEEYCLVPIANLSNALASNQYAVGNDKIEVISQHGKKFASIISIKEYQEVSSDALDGFLQLPVELIATEIFYFVDKKEVSKAFEEQAYILQVSKDAKLAEITGIDKIMNLDASIPNQFCKQQISIAIIGSDLNKLDQSIAQASRELAKIGIVHVREDINLESTFWAQLPGNFSYIRRLAPTIIENTAALASLHNFPTGSQNNIWGKAVTLLRTEKGTPYFMNFHAKSNNRGNVCIFGTANTGKTVLTNFLISEATKYKPTILYLSNNNDSKIFVESIEGQWIEKEKNLINPFILDDTLESRNFIVEFLKIICNHSFYPLTEIELAFLEIFADKIHSLDNKDRNFSSILKIIDFSIEGGELIKLKLTDYAEGGLYDSIFDSDKFPLSEGNIIGFNLYSFSEKSFIKRFYPTDRKLLEAFSMNLTKHNSLCVGLIYAFNYHLTITGKSPKILVIDSLDSLYRPENFDNISEMISDRLMKNNGIMVSNFNFSYLQSIKTRVLQNWLDLTDTKIILPSEIKLQYLEQILGLNESEIKKLSKFTITSRMFLINQDDQSIAVELSIGSLIGIIKILSCRAEELKIYQKILQQYPGHPDNWINPLYMALNRI
ncbi:transporter [Rickettsia endosymbiont of Culicoides newsteadi]|nr:transporter [Rickettsia endosymbiont of Culicoides newsteadi]